MGIFRRKKDNEPNGDDGLIIDLGFKPKDIDEDKQDSRDDDSRYSEFEPGALKGAFAGDDHTSEALDIIKKKVVKNPSAPVSDTETVSPDTDTAVSEERPTDSTDDTATLLEKCRVYTVDENGKDFSKEEDPLYRLSTVAEILKDASQKTIETFSKKYRVTIEDKTKDQSPADVSGDPDDAAEESAPMSGDRQSEDPLRPTEDHEDISDDEKFEDYILRRRPDAVVEQADSAIPDISDIDTEQKLRPDTKVSPDLGATTVYTPVKDSDGEHTRISISNTTRNIDLGDKLNLDAPEVKSASVKVQSSSDAFRDYTVETEIESKKDYIDEIKAASVKKRGAFLCVTASTVLSVIALIGAGGYFGERGAFSLPVLVFLLVTYLLNCLANIGMYRSVTKVFDKFQNADFTAAALSVATVAMAVAMLILRRKSFMSDVSVLIMLSSLLLTMRSFSAFFAASTRLGNLKAAVSKSDVFALDFIDDQNIAYSIAKDSVDGDILIAVPHRTKLINSFNKYSSYSSLLAGKFVIFQLVGIICAVLLGILGFAKYGSLIGALYSFVSALCILSFPTLFFVNTLPSYSASKRLNRVGASILGTAGAEQIDTANAVLVSTEELFPAGTIVLTDMKILSENNIDDTILRAASLTEAVGSTLTPVFKKIAKTDSAYTLPDSDTVKYEDTLGISGWVDNELLFIGNRTLMESHGIEVPSIEIDKKILRNGCFPVYVATVQKACALLIVKYNPVLSIARELRRLTGLGVTLLLVNSDPNINEAMISDYFDLYEDSIKIVSNAGKCMYENSVVSKEPMAAPATFKRKNLAFVKIMNCASRIKKSNTLFSVFYIIAAVLLAIGFIYLKFASDSLFFNTKLLFAAEISASVLALLIYSIKKP